MKKFKGLLNQVFYKFVTYWIYLFEDLQLGKKVIFKLMPQILKHKSAKISIGNGSTVNSSNYGYHINMFSKCKLFADRPNAIIKIGENTRIHGTCIHAFNKIQIGNNCLIAANTNIIDGNGHELCMENPENRIKTTISVILLLLKIMFGLLLTVSYWVVQKLAMAQLSQLEVS